jgi:hypothetical protein
VSLQPTLNLAFPAQAALPHLFHVPESLLPLRSTFLRRIAAFAFATALLVLTGCTSLHRTVATGHDPAALREIFVASNLNDGHRLAEQLASALRARGLRATHGPLTMLPPSAEAVLHYEDRWSWDFGTHLTSLRLDLHQPGEKRPYASAWRTRYIATSTDVPAALADLVAELLRPAP